jgi:hypothetical protein
MPAELVAAMDWVVLSSLATALGTLVLAVATFGAVRSANTAARTAERSLLAGLRPVLMASRLDDVEQKILWGDGHWTRIPPARAVVEVEDDVVYLSASIRNFGAGLAVIHGWRVMAGQQGIEVPHAEPDAMRRQLRDLYVPPGEAYFWQGALRDPADPDRTDVAKAVADAQIITLELLYGDQEGGQRMISRFGFVPIDAHPGVWMLSVTRHWNIDRADPR